jgi:hypothetical protein
LRHFRGERVERSVKWKVGMLGNEEGKEMD